jgi:hypothetical protein
MFSSWHDTIGVRRTGGRVPGKYSGILPQHYCKSDYAEPGFVVDKRDPAAMRWLPESAGKKPGGPRVSYALRRMPADMVGLADFATPANDVLATLLRLGKQPAALALRSSALRLQWWY